MDHECQLLNSLITFFNIFFLLSLSLWRKTCLEDGYVSRVFVIIPCHGPCNTLCFVSFVVERHLPKWHIRLFAERISF